MPSVLVVDPVIVADAEDPVVHEKLHGSHVPGHPAPTRPYAPGHAATRPARAPR